MSATSTPTQEESTEMTTATTGRDDSRKINELREQLKRQLNDAVRTLQELDDYVQIGENKYLVACGKVRTIINQVTDGKL